MTEAGLDLERDARPGIYAIIHIASGKQYIGQSVSMSHRWAQHRYELRRNHHASRHLQRAWNKHGAEAFAFTVLEYVEPGDGLRERLTGREQWHMDARLALVGSREYNTAPAAGSQLGYRFRPDILARLSVMRKGRPAWNKGLSFSSETREKMRQKKLGHRPTPAQLAALARGHELARSGQRSVEQRESIRERNYQRRGKPATSPYSRERIAGLLAYNAVKKHAAQEGLVVLTERQKAANAERRGRPLTEKQRTAYEARRGQKQTPEQIAKRDQTMRERGNHPSQRDYSSEEWKAQSAKMVGRSVETRRRKALERRKRIPPTQPALFE